MTNSRVLVVGATGPLGRAVLTHADSSLVSIRAFARRPEPLAAEFRGVDSVSEVVQGDVRDRESIVRALDGIDTVICVLGGKPWHRDAKNVHEIGTKNLIDAMRETGVRRLIVVTGVGAGSSKGHGPWYYNWFARPFVLRAVYEDKERQEALIEHSDLEWTIVRPAILVPKTPAKPILARAALGSREKMGPISRDDVAKFLLAETLSPEHIGETVHLFT